MIPAELLAIAPRTMIPPSASRFRLGALALGVALCLATSNVVAAPTFGEEEAKVHYDRGTASFDAGDFEAALKEFDASIAAERTTPALYAKAQSLNKLQRCREAVPLYKEVLSKLPESMADARAAVKDALVACAEKLAQEEDEPIPDPAVVEAEPESVDEVHEQPPEEDRPASKPAKPWYKDPYAPVLIGLGGVGVGVGAYYLSEASKESARRPEQYDDFAAKGETVRKLQIQGGVILGIGGALLLTGAIRYAVLGVRNRRASRAAFTPTFGPHTAGVSFSGRF